MFLKKLEMIGFKSFAQSTTVLFQPGITAIVGPNGCGKSNIVDAVLWVLGEQSTKTLRSDRMEDVIFNGSESRRPLSLSEVILTVGDVSGEIQGQFGDYQEIAISRRLFRTGESEYLINKTPCRLKDIRDLLIDTGAGHKGHTIIEQGKVDQLLSASMQERRELIEETAGITKYKLRRAEAERKLEATHQNLLRVSDIVGEVRRQINALDRQVKKTQVFQTLQAEARALEWRLLIAEYRARQDELSEMHRHADEIKTGESSLRAELSRFEAEAQTLKTELVQKETELSALKQSAHETQILIQRQENRIELLQNQIRAHEENRAKVVLEQARLEQSLDQAAAQETAAEQGRQEAAAALASIKARLTERESTLAGADAALEGFQKSLEEIQRRQFEKMAAITEVKNDLASLESRKKEIERIQEKGRFELASVAQQRDETGRSLEAEQSALAGLIEQGLNAEAEMGRLRAEAADREERLRALSDRMLRTRETLTVAQARQASLLENEKALTHSQSGIQTLLREPPSDWTARLHGIVADFLEVPAEYESSVEAALGEQLQGLLIDDHPTILDIVGRIKSARAGRGLFLPRSPRPLPDAAFPDGDGIIGPVLQQIRVRPGYEAVARALLGHVLLARDLDSALAVWNRGPIECLIVTLDGEILSPNGMIGGGRRTDSDQGLLMTRRVLRETEDQTLRLAEELARAEAEKLTLQSGRDSLLARLQEITLSRQELEAQINGLRQKTALLEADRRRLDERREMLNTEHRMEAEEVGGVERRLTEALGLLDSLEAGRRQIESDLSRLQGEAQALSDRRETVRGEVTQLKVDASSLTHREEALTRERERLAQEQDLLRERRRLGAEEMADLESRSRSAAEDIRTTEQTLGGLTARLTETQLRLTVQTESCAVEQNRIREAENRRDQIRTELSAVERKLNELEVRLTEVKIRMAHLSEQAEGRHQASLETAAAQPAEPDRAETPTEALTGQLAQLRTRLEQLGPVNLAAIEEYKELEERHRFLTTQEADLNQSIEDLRSAITKINRTTREMFMTAYTALREKFKIVFQEFFEGGQADLVLLDENNPLDCGIEIVAQPPGKRLRSITLLSGGEKALTAIALLFSSFLIHPSPFCVLDEIDAPLDEQNVRRFLRMLRRMTDHSQFLVITHNKRTMEQADALYGITMEEAGISKLVSVKLESLDPGNGRARALPSEPAVAG